MGNTSSCACEASTQVRHVSNDQDGLMNFNDRSRIHRNNNHEVIEGDDKYYHTHETGHELQEKDDGMIYVCSGCKLKGIGPRFSCKNARCTFNLHKDCLAPRIVQEHKFFRGSNFVFYCSPNDTLSEPCNACKQAKQRRCDHKGRYCNACSMDIKGYFYRTEGYDLHPCCINLPHKICCAESGATMKLKRRAKRECDSCGKRKVKVDGKWTDQVWSYVSQDKSCHLHVSCMMETLSDLGDVVEDIDRAIVKSGYQISPKVTVVRDGNKLNIEIAASNAKKKWEKKFETIMKYAKIVLGALISVLIGDPITLCINLSYLVISMAF